MAQTNISMVISDHAQDTIDDLIAERQKLIERLYDIQTTIAKIQLHQMIEANSAQARPNGSSETRQLRGNEVGV